MADPRPGRETGPTGEIAKSPVAQPGTDAGGFETAFTEAGAAAVAALLHLLRLMGAELVLMRPDCDPTRFEQAVRSKIGQFPSPSSNEQAREAGLAHARHLVEQVLMQIRAQAELKKSLSAGQARASSNAGSQVANLLN